MTDHGARAYDVACVLPCRNESENVGELVSRIDASLSGLSVAIVLVDDGSTDDTWNVMRDVALSREGVVCARLAPCGFGQEMAIRCGLSHAVGLSPRAVVVMDADLQDPPELLREMAEPVLAGECAQVIATRNGRGHEGVVKRVGSAVYYRLVSGALDIHEADIRNMRVMSTDVVRSLLVSMPQVSSFKYESIRSYGDARFVEYPYVDRTHGYTKYHMARLARYACEGIVSTSVCLELLPVLCGILSGVVGLAMVVAYLLCANMALLVVGIVCLCVVPVHVGVAVCCLFARMAYEESRRHGYVETEVVRS